MRYIHSIIKLVIRNSHFDLYYLYSSTTLQQRNISQYSLIKDYGFSTGTLDSLRQNKNITMKTLNDICNVLNCNVESVIKHIPDEYTEGK